MEKGNSDIFEISNKDKKLQSANNFFLEDDSAIYTLNNNSEHHRHLNDYDFNILRDGAYKEIGDDVLKLEYKMAKAEEEIGTLRSQIDAARQIKDVIQLQKLQEKLKTLQEDYKTLLALYNNKAFYAKISETISNLFASIFGKNAAKIADILSIVYEAIVARLPKRISSILKIKKSLLTLENINKSVDKLVTMDIPYGEHTDKYKQLSKYIIKANAIHSEISGYIK